MLNDLQQHFWVYVSMPFVAALIGYSTKLVAIRMMFQPLEFFGIKPWFGWQGIIPRRAEKMASIAADTLLARLISARELYSRLNPAEIIKATEKPLLKEVEEIAHDVIGELNPGVWEALPDAVKKQLVENIKKDIPSIIRAIMRDMDQDLNRVFDTKAMIVETMTRDPALLNRIFKEVGAQEFRFIAHSGIYFGFAIGCVQAITWMLTHSPIVMPVFGLFTGWFTDWLALKMIFYPKLPTKYFGIINWQGLFIKRRIQVASQYGALVAEEILTARNILNAVLTGPLSNKLFEMIVRHVKDAIDRQVGVAKPVVVLALGGETYQRAKSKAAARLITSLPNTLKSAEAYVNDTLDIKNTIVAKMKELNEEEFEAVLRPAFQQDEWILILVGAILGFAVGELQVYLMTHGGV